MSNCRSFLFSYFSTEPTKKEFCLDSGYTNAQKVWKKKFGEPDYLLKDYWGEGFDHMIWRGRTNDGVVVRGCKMDEI